MNAPFRRASVVGIVTALSVAVGCATHATPTEARPASQPEVGVRRIEAPAGVLVKKACASVGPELCFNAVDDNCNGIIDEGCGVQTGLVQFAAAWGDASADVDLNVTDPAGELAEAGRPTESGLTKDRDCPGARNECHGQNLENVFLEPEKELQRGRYRVRLRLEKLGSEDPPVHVTFGARVGPKVYAAEIDLSRPEEEAELIFEL